MWYGLIWKLKDVLCLVLANGRAKSLYMGGGGKSVSLALLRWPMHVTRMLCFHRVIQWSFGVTCWEIFSGGKTPYPGVDPLSLVQLLENGRRLEKPLNAACSDTMYVLSVYISL